MAFSVASVMVQMLLFAVTPSSHRSQIKHQGNPLAANFLHASKSVPIWWPVWWNLRRHSGLGAVLCGWCDQVHGLPSIASPGLGESACSCVRSGGTFLTSVESLTDDDCVTGLTIMCFLYYFYFDFTEALLQQPAVTFQIFHFSPPFTSSHVTE